MPDDDVVSNCSISFAKVATPEDKKEDEEEEWTVVDETLETSTYIKAETPEPVSREISIQVTYLSCVIQWWPNH